jgi:hypothetical protein
MSAIAVIIFLIIGLVLIFFPNAGKKYDTQLGLLIKDPQAYQTAVKCLGYLFVVLSCLVLIASIYKVARRP